MSYSVYNAQFHNILYDVIVAVASTRVFSEIVVLCYK